VPVISPDDVVVSYFNREGKKEYTPIRLFQIVEPPSDDLTLQDTLVMLGESWSFNSSFLELGYSLDFGNILLDENEVLEMGKEKKKNLGTFEGEAGYTRITGGSFFGKPRSMIEFDGKWKYQDGCLKILVEGEAFINYPNKPLNNFWKHELQFKITKINKNEIELLLEKKNSERLKKED